MALSDDFESFMKELVTDKLEAMKTTTGEM